MAYNNYFPATYYPQYQQPIQQIQQPQQQDNGIIWVSGIEGAKSFLVSAGKSVLLMDSESSVFYIKSTDMSGMPQPLRIFDYTERTAQQQTDAPAHEIDTSMFVTRDELESRLASITSQQKKKGDTK